MPPHAEALLFTLGSDLGLISRHELRALSVGFLFPIPSPEKPPLGTTFSLVHIINRNMPHARYCFGTCYVQWEKNVIRNIRKRTKGGFTIYAKNFMPSLLIFSKFDICWLVFGKLFQTVDLSA